MNVIINSRSSSEDCAKVPDDADRLFEYSGRDGGSQPWSRNGRSSRGVLTLQIEGRSPGDTVDSQVRNQGKKTHVEPGSYASTLKRDLQVYVIPLAGKLALQEGDLDCVRDALQECMWANITTHERPLFVSTCGMVFGWVHVSCDNQWPMDWVKEAMKDLKSPSGNIKATGWWGLVICPHHQVHGLRASSSRTDCQTPGGASEIQQPWPPEWRVVSYQGNVSLLQRGLSLHLCCRARCHQIPAAAGDVALTLLGKT